MAALLTACSPASYHTVRSLFAIIAVDNNHGGSAGDAECLRAALCVGGRRRNAMNARSCKTCREFIASRFTTDYKPMAERFLFKAVFLSM